MTKNIPCLTRSSLNALTEATRQSSTRRPWTTGTLHLLIGLSAQSDSIAGCILRTHEVSAANMWAAIDYWYAPSPRLIGRYLTPSWTKASRLVVERSLAACESRGGRNIDTGDLLCAIMSDEGSRAVKLLERAGLDTETLLLEVKVVRETSQEGPGIRPIPEMRKARPISMKPVS